MKTVDFLAHLRSLDIVLSRDGEKLRISAPEGALTPQLRQELAGRKAEILEFLRASEESTPAASQSISKANRTGSSPLSFAQQRLWFLDQLSPGSAAYIIAMGVRLYGVFDQAALERSIAEIVRRHEVLRTIFVANDGVPQQVPLEPGKISIPLTDLSHLPVQKRLPEAEQAAYANAREPFDLTQWPLFRARLLRLDQQDHVLLFAVHHIVFDAWSSGVFTRELSSWYNTFHFGNVPQWPELQIQYIDFACWQREHLAGAVREKQLAYWKQKLGGELHPLELPADHPRPAAQTSRGEKRVLQIPAPLTRQLKDLAHTEGASLAMTLLAGFNVLLNRLSGQDDILVGIPVAGRSRKETEALIGFFVNTLVIRADLSGSPSFRKVLAQVRNAMLDAYAHQDMPFEELLEVLAPHRELNRTPIFQVFFNHLNVDIPRLELAGLKTELFGNLALESKFDLTLYVSEPDDTLSLLLVYNADLFDAPRIEALAEQYRFLLEQLCAKPDTPVRHYSLVTPQMKNRLPDPAAPLESRWSGAVQERVAFHASRTPERIAAQDLDGKWTYAELDRLSSRLAGWLRDGGIQRGDVIAIYGHRSAPLVLAVLGVLRAQAAFCILDPAHPSARLCHCLEAARPKGWLQLAQGGELPQNLETLIQDTVADRRLILPRTHEVASIAQLSNSESLPDQTGPDWPAYVTFTSGTTGTPKCIVGTHRPLSHFMEWHCAQFGFDTSDRFSMLSGLSHDPLLRDIFAPLWCGAAICIPRQEDILSPGQLTQWMLANQATVAHLTPALGALLGESSSGEREANAPLPLRHAFFGGDVLTRRDALVLHRLAPNAQIVNFYGATETPQAMAWHRITPAELERWDTISESAAWSIPLGRPISDAQILVLNKSGALAGVGELGEIFIRTPYLSLGYSNDQGLTCERFLQNPFTGTEGDRFYRTGDLGRYRPDGTTEFCGRSDRQVKIRGYRIELREVEAALSTHPRVRECVVASCPGQQGSRLVAWVVPREERPPVDSLRDHLKTTLPDYMIPSSFGYLEALSLTPNGKINRSLLPIPEDDRPELAAGYVPPRNRVERALAQIWSEVMGIQKVGVFDNFFELGGHSLSAARLIARMRSTLKIDLPLRSVFVQPTIAELSKHIRYDALTKTFHFSNEIPRWNCLVPIQPKGSRPPLFLVCGAHADEDEFLRFLAHIVSHLGLDQPVYGFKPRGLDGQADPRSSVEEIARDHLAEVREFLPNGPYLLAGECVGGVVAFEMAQQLWREGKEVAMLALLDTERPTSWRAFLSSLRFIRRNSIYRANKIREVLKAPARNWPRLAWEFMRPKLISLFPKTTEDHVIRRIREVELGYAKLTFRYRAQSYPGLITLIVNEFAHARNAHLGWEGASRQGLNIYCVPGDHVTRLTLHGKTVADRLSRCIDEAISPKRQQAAWFDRGNS